MIIVRLLSPERSWLVATKVYSGLGADFVMESITLIDPGQSKEGGFERNRDFTPFEAHQFCSVEVSGPKLPGMVGKETPRRVSSCHLWMLNPAADSSMDCCLQ
jgi:hypothetical protein